MEEEGVTLQAYRKARGRKEGKWGHVDLLNNTEEDAFHPEHDIISEETNHGDEDVRDREDLEEENRRLRIQLRNLTSGERIPLHKFGGDWIRFGVLSDTHLGSYYAHLDLLHLAYRFYEKEGITKVYHSGDLCDGERMYRGQEYELETHGADAQIAYCKRNYPDMIDTYFVTGNHDLSFWKHAGIDIGDRIEAIMPSMHYLGQDWADVTIEDEGGNKATLRLLHPGKGSSYAISYVSQKYIEALYGGEKPNFLCIGHFHKVEYLFYRNIHMIQSGTVERQTPFMQRRNLAAMTGFWLVELMLDEIGITRCRAEFIPQYT